MGQIMPAEIRVTPQKRITVAGGDVLHALKCSDPDFHGFGEAYFSFVAYGAVKAWKMHTRMILNLVVPVGTVKFVFFSADGSVCREETIGDDNYCRLTVPPGLWFGFQGLAGPWSLLMNVADIPHEPDEVERKEREELAYSWEVLA